MHINSAHNDRFKSNYIKVSNMKKNHSNDNLRQTLHRTCVLISHWFHSLTLNASNQQLQGSLTRELEPETRVDPPPRPSSYKELCTGHTNSASVREQRRTHTHLFSSSVCGSIYNQSLLRRECWLKLKKVDLQVVQLDNAWKLEWVEAEVEMNGTNPAMELTE